MGIIRTQCEDRVHTLGEEMGKSPRCQGNKSKEGYEHGSRKRKKTKETRCGGEEMPKSNDSKTFSGSVLPCLERRS